MCRNSALLRENKIQGGEPPAMDAVDWRTQFKPVYRQRIVNMLVEEFKKHMASFDLEEDLFLDEVKQVSQRLEERFYNGATNGSSYLGNISFFMSKLKEDHWSADQESPVKRQKVSESDDNSFNARREIASFLSELSVGFLMEKRRRLLVELAVVKAEMQRRVAVEELNHDRRELGLLKAYWDGIRWCRDMVILENPGIPLSFEFIPPGFDDEDDDDM